MNEFHNDVDDMVKCFVQYMPCDSQVQREVAACGRSVDMRTVAAFRARWERRMKLSHLDQDETVVKEDKKYSRNMNAANQRFVCALLEAGAA